MVSGLNAPNAPVGPSRRHTTSRAPLLAAAMPVVLWLVVEAGMLAMAAVGPHPLWPELQLTLTEAVAVRSTADVAAQLEGGADPNRAYPVRPGLLAGEPERATPLEAATSERRPEIIALLARHGAVLAIDDWRRLRCFVDGFDADVAAALDALRPPAAELACPDGEPRIW